MSHWTATMPRISLWWRGSARGCPSQRLDVQSSTALKLAVGSGAILQFNSGVTGGKAQAKRRPGSTDRIRTQIPCYELLSG